MPWLSIDKERGSYCDCFRVHRPGAGSHLRGCIHGPEESEARVQEKCEDGAIPSAYSFALSSRGLQCSFKGILIIVIIMFPKFKARRRSCSSSFPPMLLWRDSFSLSQELCCRRDKEGVRRRPAPTEVLILWFVACPAEDKPQDRPSRRNTNRFRGGKRSTR